MGLSNSVCRACLRRDRNLLEGAPFLFSKENNIDPGVVPKPLRDLTQIKEIVIIKVYYYIIIKRVYNY
jgi:hypothetical protein